MSDGCRELSPRGAGAISVLRLEGPRAAALLRELAPGLRLAPGGIEFVRLVQAGEALDEALVCTLGPECHELHVHGSPPLVERLSSHFARAQGSAARREAEPASLEARAWARLAGVPGEAGARILLDQAQGALRAELAALRTAAAGSRAAAPAVRAIDPDARARAIDALLARGHAARFALEPAVVVLAGPVNAGKSTLFNALVGERRAIVSAEPGTTRDLVLERGRLGAWPVRWIDGAGERADPPDDAAGGIERAGQERARAARARADLVLWLEPCSGDRLRDERRLFALAASDTIVHAPAELASRPRPARVEARLVTCVDRLDPAPRGADGRAISARERPDQAREVVLDLFQRALGLPHDPWLPGAGVPFEAGQLAALAELRHGGVSADRESRFESWLEHELAALP